MYQTYGGMARAATGDFDGDGWDEFVIAWESTGSKLQMQWYKPARDAYGTIYAQTLISPGWLGAYRFLDVVTGDFNADGKDEIAATWSDNAGQLVAGVYTATADGKLTLKAQYAEKLTLGKIVATAGDFNADGIDEIAVGFNLRGLANVYIFQVTNNLATLTRVATFARSHDLFWDIFVELVAHSFDLTAGDFNGDGVDELALATPTKSLPDTTRVDLTIIDATTAFTLTQRASAPLRYPYYTQPVELDAGDLNTDMAEEIVVGWTNLGYGWGDTFSLESVQVAPDLLAWAEKGSLLDNEQVYQEDLSRASLRWPWARMTASPSIWGRPTTGVSRTRCRPSPSSTRPPSTRTRSPAPSTISTSPTPACSSPAPTPSTKTSKSRARACP